MTQITKRSIEEIAAHTGEHTIDGLRFRPARQALGVSAWGMNVMEFDAGCTGYPAHDHQQDGQEEVYVVLSGALTLQIGSEEHALTAGDFVRVPPEVSRKFVTEDSAATLLAIGATPGKAFVPNLA